MTTQYHKHEHSAERIALAEATKHNAPRVVVHCSAGFTVREPKRALHWIASAGSGVCVVRTIEPLEV